MIFLEVHVHQFWPSVTRGWVDGWEAGRGGEGGGKNPQVETQSHQSPSDGPNYSTIGQRDTIPVKGRIPHPIGMLHRCQCVGHGFTRL